MCDGHGSGGGNDIDGCWAEFGPCSSWAWPIFVLYVVNPGVRPIGVFELNIKFGIFRPVGVLGLGLLRWALSHIVFSIGFLPIVGLRLGLGR